MLSLLNNELYEGGKIVDLKGAKIRDIYHLCTEINENKNDEKGKLCVRVPYYQRPYKWGEDQIKELFSDYAENSDNSKGKKDYFIGSVVMVLPEKEDSDMYEIVDGQQRVTTLFLLNYIKVLLLRALIDAQISHQLVSSMTDSLSKFMEAYNDLLGTQHTEDIAKGFSEIKEIIDDISDKKDDERSEAFEKLLCKYREIVCLPENETRDESAEYLDSYVDAMTSFFNDDILCLSYDHNAYNEQLRKALSRVVIHPLNEGKVELSIWNADGNKGKKDIANQYTDAIKCEFEMLSQQVSSENGKRYTQTNELINYIDSMLRNLQLCVIITGNEKDAYSLFEVLNDRSLEVDDLDLVKNMFMREYCHGQDEKKDIEDEIDMLDTTWVNDVFSSDPGDKQKKLIAFLGTEYLTADESISMKQTSKYSDVIDKNYLSQIQKPYEYISVLNDFRIYQAARIILDEFGITPNNNPARCLIAEDSADKSITYKSFCLIKALKQDGVLQGLTNLMIHTFFEKRCFKNGKEIEFSIDGDNGFVNYIDQIRDDKENANPEFMNIHICARNLRRMCLLSNDYNKPLDYSKNIAHKVTRQNNGDIQGDLKLSDDNMGELHNDFIKWTTEWRYESGQNIKVKSLFIDLLNMNKDDNCLKESKIGIKEPNKWELDHLEADKKDKSAEEKFFEPIDRNQSRDMYTGSLGNFMLLDKNDNIAKSQRPLWYAIKEYDGLAQRHWLTEEFKEMLNDDDYSVEVVIDKKIIRKPKEEFFTERTKRLQSYFYAVINMPINAKEVSITEL